MLDGRWRSEDRNVSTPQDVSRYLEAIRRDECPARLDWSQFLAIPAPYAGVRATQREVTTRYRRNGYEWDIHATLHTPEREVDFTLAFVFFHGGADTEKVFDLTPDGRPGTARVLAEQGFKVLAITYPGHYAPGNRWDEPIATRQPVYLLDRKLGLEETLDRNLKCTFNTILQGAGQLVSENLGGRRIIAWGHSTGGPMAAALHAFAPGNRVIGLAGFGTGGPDGWRKEWREKTGAEKFHELAVDHVSRRSPTTYREAGYEDPEDLTPWGKPEALFRWAEHSHRSQIKTSLCDNQHRAIVEALPRYAAHTGLPLSEYTDHLQDPPSAWLETIAVLAVVGDNDKGHWVAGKEIADKREMFMIAKYREAGVKRAQVVLVPRYGHFGFMELHNEKLAYLWLWALQAGYFD